MQTALFHGDPSFAYWFARLPLPNKEEAADQVRKLCINDRPAESRRAVNAVITATKTDMLVAENKQLLAQVFAAVFGDSANIDEKEDEAESLNPEGARQKKEAAARVLWPMRNSLSYGQKAMLSPTMTSMWLRENRRTLAAMGSGAVLVACVLAIAWIINERLQGSWHELPTLYAASGIVAAVSPYPPSSVFVAAPGGRTKGDGATVLENVLINGLWTPIGNSLTNEPVHPWLSHQTNLHLSSMLAFVAAAYFDGTVLRTTGR